VIGVTSSLLIDSLRRARGRASRAEEMLRESAAGYRTLFNYAPDGILIADSQSYYLDANPSMCRLLGYTRDELIGLHASDIVAQSEIKHIDPALEAISSKSNYYREWKFKRKDGSLFAGEVIGATMPDGSLVGIVRDVSERKRTEQALRDLDVAEQASRLKSEFLAKMSHELRTPLNAILGFTGTLLMKLPGPLNADQERQLGTVQTSAKHLLALIKDLLDLAKIDAGKTELQLEPTRCSSVIEETIASLRPLAELKTLRLRFDPPAAEVVVQTDRRALSQIIINLVSNAIKFTDHGSVRVTLAQAESDGKRVLDLGVQDTGVGIRAEDQAGLFTEFTRLDGTKDKEGTGLGLHLSQKLAAVLGGTIICRSEYGKGSTFTLQLPLG
jgi:protein-histidine pros-kinase